MSGIVRKQQQIPSSLSCHAQSVLICSYRDACLLCIAGSELEYIDNIRVQVTALYSSILYILKAVEQKTLSGSSSAGHILSSINLSHEFSITYLFL